MRSPEGTRTSGETRRPPELVERQREIESIEAALGGAREGNGTLLLIEGYAGLGKSALLSRAAETARGEEFAVLKARPAALEREFPFGVTLQLFEPQLARASPAEREALLAGAASLARPVLERLGANGAGQDQMLSLLHGFYWLMSNLAERSPLLVLVDDLHWSDRSSLQFLLYVAQRLEDLPAAVVGAARPGEPGAAQELLARLRASPSVRLLEPRPLTVGGVERLVRARHPEADPHFVSACASVTAGNPFLVRELLATLEQRGVTAGATEAERIGTLAPDSVLHNTILRLEELPEGAPELARSIAVFGDGTPLRRAACLAGLDLDRAGSLADALATVEILHRGDPLGFVHPLLRSSVHASIPEGERARAHLEAARILADEEAAPEAVASHLLEARESGETWAVESLLEAGREAMAHGTPESAVLYLSRALAEPPPPPLRARTLLALSEAEAAVGDAAALDHLDRALELIADPRERAEALLRAGWAIIKLAGGYPKAADVFERGLRELGERDEALADRLWSGYLGAALVDPVRGEEAQAQVRSLQRRSSETLTGAEHGLFSALALAGAFAGSSHEDVRQLAERALAEGRLLADEGPESFGYWNAVGCLSWADALEAAVRTCDAALEETRRRGAIVTAAQCYYARSWPNFWMGNLAEAVTDAQAAVDGWSGDWGMYLPAAVYWLVVARIERDELEAAAGALDYPHPERYRGTAFELFDEAARGHLAAVRGDAEPALQHFLAGGKAGLTHHLSNPAIVPWRSSAALAARALGQPERARALAAEELELARAFGAPRPIGTALRASGLVEGGEQGVKLLQAAVGVLRDSPSRLELSRALVDLGAMTRRQGRPAAARELLREGLVMAEGFEALALERRARQELLAAGAKPRQRTLSGVDALTPGELRVARMAAAGMANREIAQELFVTVKAIKFHLSNVYRKLEIDSRAALPAALEARS